MTGTGPAACDGGMGTAEAAETFSVSPAWVRRLKPRRETGEITLGAATPGPVLALAPHAGRLRQEAWDHPGRTAAEYRDRLGADVAVVTVWRMLRRLGPTHEQSPPGPPSGTTRTSRRSGRRGSPR